MVLSAWLDDVSYLLLFGFCFNFVVVFNVEALPKRMLCLAWEAQSGTPAGCLDGPSAVCFCWVLQTCRKPSIWWHYLLFALSSGLLQSLLQGVSGQFYNALLSTESTSTHWLLFTFHCSINFINSHTQNWKHGYHRSFYGPYRPCISQRGWSLRTSC